MNKPKYESKLKGYVWYCAFADCIAYNYILPGSLYDQLRGEYRSESNYYGGKFYKTEKQALKALENARHSLYYNVKYMIKHLRKEDIDRLKEDLERTAD